MDPLLLLGISAMAFLATGFWILAAIFVWLAYRRVPKASLGLAGASLAVMLLAMAAMPPGYDPDEVARVQRLHDQFGPRLEAYRQEHGAYPPTLESVGIATPQTRYGPLDYSTHTDSAGQPVYALALGNYFANGFVAFWSSTHRTWELDT